MARAIAAPASTPGSRLRMTYDEWHAWSNEERNRGEWVDGEVIVFAMSTVLHQLVVGFLYRLVWGYLDRSAVGVVLMEPTEMWLPGKRTARLPDLFFVANEHLDRLSESRLEGPGDLVVEVVCDDSVTQDRRVKFREYADAGIPEYLVVDPRPRQRWAVLHRLDDDGTYQQVDPDHAGRLRFAALPGFWLEPAWLWQSPPPAIETLMSSIFRG